MNDTKIIPRPHMIDLTKDIPLCSTCEKKVGIVKCAHIGCPNWMCSDHATYEAESHKPLCDECYWYIMNMFV